LCVRSVIDPQPLAGSFAQPQSSGEADLPSRETSIYPFCNPISVDANHIVSIGYIGRKHVYDFTVAENHNYIAGGLIHHNTEGVGGYEVTLHLTGLYPDWWVGHRFKQPTDGWAAGKNSQSTRDIIQAKLFGKVVRRHRINSA
jgi:hypothetical protein